MSREKELENALLRILDDWANENYIREDALKQAGFALDLREFVYEVAGYAEPSHLQDLSPGIANTAPLWSECENGNMVPLYREISKQHERAYCESCGYTESHDANCPRERSEELIFPNGTAKSIGGE